MIIENFESKYLATMAHEISFFKFFSPENVRPGLSL